MEAMPLYEYSCSRCGRRIEILQRVGADASGLECPECGTSSLEREFSTFASCGSGDGAACAPRGAFT
jgi:putative FmdB family regulatory protein